MGRSPLAVFGDTVRRLRREKQWSQEELAERANVHLNFVGRLERGQIVSPELISILKLAIALEVGPSMLLADFTPAVMRKLRPLLRREARNPHQFISPTRRR